MSMVTDMNKTKGKGKKGDELPNVKVSAKVRTKKGHVLCLLVACVVRTCVCVPYVAALFVLFFQYCGLVA